MNTSRSLTTLALLGPALLAACGGGSSGGGVAVAEGPPPPLVEIEPNDNAAFADYIGEILPGDYLEIQGHVSECCSDPYDGFAFYAPGPVELILTLNEANAGADLDFCIYDPTIDQMVACWETDTHPEVGVFNYAGPGEFHVVIASYLGDSQYLLQVDVRPISTALAAVAGGPVEANRAPSPSAVERFADYSRLEVDQAPTSRPRELILLSDDANEALLLPGGALSPAGF